MRTLMKPRGKTSTRTVAPRVGMRLRRNDNGQGWLVLACGVQQPGENKLVVVENETSGEIWACPSRTWTKPPTVRELQVDQWKTRPSVGTVYQHFRGDYYRVLANAFHAEDGQHLVVYRAENGGRVCLSTIAHWQERVQVGSSSIPRFCQMS